VGSGTQTSTEEHCWNKMGIQKHAPVARLKAIRLLLSYAINHGIILYQMDVKSAFLNGVISKEVFVKQPPCFEDLKHPDHIRNHYMVLYKLLELGMIDLVIS